MAFPQTILPHYDFVPAIPAQINRQVLNYMRVQAARHRCAPRLDLFAACQMISPVPSVALDAYSGAALRCLNQATEAPAPFMKPGVEAYNFQEAWLVRCIDCLLRNDHDSFAFLLQRRVTVYKRQAFAKLLRGISDHWNPN